MGTTTGYFAKLKKMSLASMEKHLFNLKFAAKDLERCSKKCDKEEKAEKLKLKKAIEKGIHEVARIHAENAIRQKNQSLNYLRMSARVDATASRVQSALKSMNLEKISGLMDQFEKEFEDLDVQTSVMEGAMSQTTATNVPQDSVEVLMRQAADEAGLELKMDLPGPAESTVGQSTKASVEQDELSQRLSRLRQT